MAKRKNAKKVAAGKKAARTRKRRAAARKGVATQKKRATARRYKRTPVGRKRTMVVFQRKRGRLTRSPRSRLGYSKTGRKVYVNPGRRRRFSVQKWTRRLRFNQALPIIGGMALGIAVKPMVEKTVLQVITNVKAREFVSQWSGVITIAGGVIVSMQSRKQLAKNVGLGLIIGGIYDVVGSNFAKLPFIDKYMPILSSAPDTTTGANLGYGSKSYQSVGANIVSGVTPDVVGSDMDIEDVLDTF